jgi:NCS1 family nucleobase:cation symporter-1
MSTVLAIYGYRHIHRFSHFAAILSGVVFLGLFVRLLVDPQTGTAFAQHTFAAAPFILGISLAASWQLTFGPYIADYSRYLPQDTPKSATIGWTFLGSVAGASLAMVLGAMVAAIGGKAFLGDQVGYLAHLGGPASMVVLLAVICGKLTGDTLSTYGGYMSVVTIVTSLTGEKTVRPRHRTLYICAISVAALAIALAATSTFLSTFTNFLLFLLYFMTPWSAINLVDYYWVRRERYQISELFNPRGIYGRVNKGAFLAYLVGVVIQIPFMNSSLYVGPIANWLGGAEVAWVLGLIVAGGLYYALSAGVRRSYATNYDHITSPATAPTP